MTAPQPGGAVPAPRRGANLAPLADDGTGWAIGHDERYLVWFDGETAKRLDVPKRQRSVRPFIFRSQVAADGSIWIIVRDDRQADDRITGDGLYVITPEAVAATE